MTINRSVRGSCPSPPVAPKRPLVLHVQHGADRHAARDVGAFPGEHKYDDGDEEELEEGEVATAAAAAAAAAAAVFQGAGAGAE